LAHQSRLYFKHPLLNHHQQQQQQQQDEAELLLNIPEYEVEGLAGGSSTSSADGEDASDAPEMASNGSSSRSTSSTDVNGTHTDEPAQVDTNEPIQQQQQQPCKSRRMRRVARAASWFGPGFTIEPAPDAAAVLMHSSASSVHQQQQQQAVQEPAHRRSYSQLMYVYDLLSPASASVNAHGAAVDPKLFKVRWTASSQQQQQARDDAAASVVWDMQQQQPRFTTSRYITGSGNLHGGLVVEIRQASEAAAAAGAHNMSVCIFQVVPWQIRLWLHTLQLSIDGQVSSRTVT
jgi:hypothetical protein